MVTAKVKILNPQGLHMRPAHRFAAAMQRFACDVTVVCGGRSFSAKSIFQVMGSGVRQGDVVELRCDGPDEAEALAEAVGMIEAGLGEAI